MWLVYAGVECEQSLNGLRANSVEFARIAQDEIDLQAAVEEASDYGAVAVIKLDEAKRLAQLVHSAIGQ